MRNVVLPSQSSPASPREMGIEYTITLLGTKRQRARCYQRETHGGFDLHERRMLPREAVLGKRLK